MNKERNIQLRKNFGRLFWVRAFLNIKFVNIVLSLFYIHRGLTLSEIFYLGFFWAGAALLFEVPSSYLADRWGRKPTILLGISLMSIHWLLMLFGYGFFRLALAVVIYGMSFACITGTDEALVYDTERELGREKKSLGKFGKYRSARNIFKIVTPVIAVFIAKDLTALQFQFLLAADIVATFVAFFLASRLIESNHKMDVVEVEASVMRDAVRIIRREKGILRAILNQETLFFAVFIPWVIFQTFFVDLGVSIVFIGIVWGIRHGVVFLWSWYVEKIVKDRPIEMYINRLADLFTLGALLMVLFLYTVPNPVFLYIFYVIVNVIQSFRDPFFSEFFHKRFRSYNRATTISLSNVLHNLIEMPLIFLSGVLVAFDSRFPFVIAFVLGLIVVLFLRIPLPKDKKT
jgi:MFS family permease